MAERASATLALGRRRNRRRSDFDASVLSGRLRRDLRRLRGSPQPESDAHLKRHSQSNRSERYTHGGPWPIGRGPYAERPHRRMGRYRRFRSWREGDSRRDRRLVWREPDGLKLGDTGGYSRRDRAEVCVADELKITAGPFTFVGRLETKL